MSHTYTHAHHGSLVEARPGSHRDTNGMHKRANSNREEQRRQGAPLTNAAVHKDGKIVGLGSRRKNRADGARNAAAARIRAKRRRR